MAGADGRELVEGPPVPSAPPSLPPTLPLPPQYPAAHTARHVPPSMHGGRGHSVRGTFPPNLLQCSQPVLMLCQASHLATRLLFL